MDSFDAFMNFAVVAIAVIFVIWIIKKGIYCPQEKETIIVERLGKFHSIMNPGINCIIPILDRTKKISVRYLISDPYENVRVVKKTSEIISTQNEVTDFPRQYTF